MSTQAQRLSEPEITCKGKQACPGNRAVGTDLENRFYWLSIVLERMWLFYEAMRSGKPLTNSDEIMAQVGTALRNATNKSK